MTDAKARRGAKSVTHFKPLAQWARAAFLFGVCEMTKLVTLQDVEAVISGAMLAFYPEVKTERRELGGVIHLIAYHDGLELTRYTITPAAPGDKVSMNQALKARGKGPMSQAAEESYFVWGEDVSAMIKRAQREDGSVTSAPADELRLLRAIESRVEKAIERGIGDLAALEDARQLTKATEQPEPATADAVKGNGKTYAIRVPVKPKHKQRWVTIYRHIRPMVERHEAIADIRAWLSKTHPKLQVGIDTLSDIITAGRAGYLHN